MTCPSPTSCFAVGDRRGTDPGIASLVEHWNGTGWTIIPSPNPANANYANLGGVSCPTTTSCFAVGASENKRNSRASVLVERWDGLRWSIVPVPNLGPNYDSWLLGVSCAGVASCVAVGFFSDGMLIERWDGNRWSAKTIPPKGPDKDTLFGVSCPSPTSCFAVGNSFSPTAFVERAVVEHWNGHRWTIMSGTPSPTAFDQLQAVSCHSPTSCVAVGGASAVTGSGPGHELIEHWNGHGSWKIMTTQPPNNAYLTGVSCPTAKNCFAVGTRTLHATANTLAEHWNGHGGWTVMAIPNPPNTSLRGLSCPNTASCDAVGSTRGAQDNDQRTLAERYG